MVNADHAVPVPHHVSASSQRDARALCRIEHGEAHLGFGGGSSIAAIRSIRRERR
jgi:hypothetical protein